MSWGCCSLAAVPETLDRHLQRRSSDECQSGCFRRATWRHGCDPQPGIKTGSPCLVLYFTKVMHSNAIWGFSGCTCLLSEKSNTSSKSQTITKTFIAIV